MAGKKPRWGWVGLFIGVAAGNVFLIVVDETRWHRFLFLLVAVIGIYLECFVRDPRRTS